jgi:predicted acetyltransferase
MRTKIGAVYECEICGRHFVKEHENQKYCSEECRREAQCADYKKYADEKRLREKIQAMRKKIENNSFNKTLKELDRYNKKNNCSLSYGQFMLLKQKVGAAK